MKQKLTISAALLLAGIVGAVLQHYYNELTIQNRFSQAFVDITAKSPSMETSSLIEHKLPTLLVIGDSISKGYLPPLRKILKNRFHIIHIDDNARTTAYTLKHLRAWLRMTPRFDYVLYNNGLHDLERIQMDDDAEVSLAKVPEENYKQNLEAILTIFMESDAKLIFATTTPIPEKASGWLSGREIEYNQAAIKIVRKHGGAICDLHTISLPLLPIIQNRSDVHFNPIGSWVLALAITSVLLNQL